MLINCSDSTYKLACQIAKKFQLNFINLSFEKFSNGELFLDLQNNIEAKKVYLVQDLMNNPHDRLLELMIAAHSLKILNSKLYISAILPYLCYSRADKKITAYSGVTSELILKLLKASAIDQIIAIDLHKPAIMSFFDGEFINLNPTAIFCLHIKNAIDISNLVIIAADEGSYLRACSLAQMMGLKFYIAKKSRDFSVSFKIEGDVDDRNCIIIDDIIDTGQTIVCLSENLKKMGAKNIYVYASHGLFSGNALEIIESSCIKFVAILKLIDIEYTSSKVLQLECCEIFNEIFF